MMIDIYAINDDDDESDNEDVLMYSVKKRQRQRQLISNEQELLTITNESF